MFNTDRATHVPRHKIFIKHHKNAEVLKDETGRVACNILHATQIPVQNSY